MEKNTHYNKFMKNLSWGFMKENDLSNMVWTMCQTSRVFKRIFIQFFFDLPEDCDEGYLAREITRGNSRADFIYTYKGDLFVIENKIDDQGHHFDQYTEDFKIAPDHLGYIANYSIKDQPEFSPKTWKDFYTCLESRHQCFSEDEQYLYIFFLDYLTNICSLWNNKETLMKQYSLYEWNKQINETLQFEFGIISITPLNKNLENLNLDKNSSYINWDFKINWDLKPTIASLRIYFKKDIAIYVKFDKQSETDIDVYSLLTKIDFKPAVPLLASFPYSADGSMWFDFRKNEEFLKATIEEKNELIRDYIKDIVNSILLSRDIGS